MKDRTDSEDHCTSATFLKKIPEKKNPENDPGKYHVFGHLPENNPGKNQKITEIIFEYPNILIDKIVS